MIKVIKEGIQKHYDIKDAKLNESKKYTDEEKKDIFKRWSEYSKKKYGYKQEYNYKGYTDDTYAKWDKILSKDSNYTEDYEDDLPFDSADYPEELIDQDEKDELEFQKTHDGMTRSEYNQAYDGPYGYVKD